MHEHRQPFSVKHQPRNHLAKFLRGENRLIHGIKVRTDGLIVPATEVHGESAQTLSHARGSVASLCRVIIDMGMVTLDHTLAHRTPLFERLMFSIIKSGAMKPNWKNFNQQKRIVKGFVDRNAVRRGSLGRKASELAS